jgi:hypothetical protein
MVTSGKDDAESPLRVYGQGSSLSGHRLLEIIAVACAALQDQFTARVEDAARAAIRQVVCNAATHRIKIASQPGVCRYNTGQGDRRERRY